MRIPLPKMMRHWREREYERQDVAAGLPQWLEPLGVVRQAADAVPAGLEDRHGLPWAWAGAKGRFRSLPLAGGWTAWRDMPAPEGKTFHQLWAERRVRPTEGRPSSDRKAA